MAGPINNNNFGKKLGNMAKKAKQRADNGKNFDVMDPGASNPNVEKAKKNAGKAASKAIKNVGKAIGKLVKSLIKALLSLGWVGILILVILILILIIIAIVTAINIMPGMMKSKLAQLFKINVGNWFMNGAAASLAADYSDIIDVANYIESMNYSLIGDGFVTPNLERENDIYTISEVLAKNPTYVYKTGTDGKTHFYYEDFSIDNLTEAQARSLDESKRVQMKYYDNLGRTIINSTGMPENSGDEYTDEYGIIRSTEARDAGDGTDRGKVVRVAENGRKNYRLLRTYLLSNYRIYNLKNADEGVLNTLGNIYREIFGGNQDAWAKGLVKLYIAEGGYATDHWWWGDVGIGSIAQMTETTLTLQKGFFNQPIEFSITGWSPRYGLSLDFLLALHLGTGAPDLVYAILQNFDTEVQVYLDDAGDSKVDSRFVDPNESGKPPVDGDSIDKIEASLNKAGFSFAAWGINDLAALEWANPVFLTKRVCQILLTDPELTFTSPDSCTGAGQADMIEKSTYDTQKNYFNEYSITKDMDPEIYEVFDDFEGYEFQTNDGGNLVFNMQNCSQKIGTSDASYEDPTFTWWPGIAQECGFNLSKMNAPNVQDMEPEVYKRTTSMASSNNAGDIYKIKRIKNFNAWIAPREGEQIEYEWYAYKYLIYKVGTYAQPIVDWEESGDPNDPGSIPIYGEPENTYFDNPEWVDTFIVEFIVRDKTRAEAMATGILTVDDEGNDVYNLDQGKCSEQVIVENAGTEDEKVTLLKTKCCPNCQRYVKAAVAALAQISDQDYSAYTPYIARVVGSWFRDTYFVIPNSPDAAINEYAEIDRAKLHGLTYAEYDDEGNLIHMHIENPAIGTNHPEFNIKNTYNSGSAVFVEVDEEYLGDSGEYWTSYETKPDGEYQLYVLNANGTTSTQKLESFLEQGYIKEFYIENSYDSDDVNYYKNGYLKEQYLSLSPNVYLVKDESGDNILVAPNTFETQDEAEEAGWAFVKKARTIDVEDFVEKHNIWRESSSSDRISGDKILWSAYAFDSNGLVRPWSRVPRGSNDKVDALYDIIYPDEEDYFSGIFYQLSTTNNVTQVEDAQRGETNALVKYLFKYRKFYLYDGSESTALAIAHDKQRILYGYDNYVAQDYDYEDKYYNNKVITDEYSIKDIVEGRKYGTENVSGGENFYHYRGLLNTSENGNKGVLATLYGDDWYESGKVKKLLNKYGRSALRQSYSWATLANSIDKEDLALQWLDWQLDMFYMDKYGVNLKEYYGISDKLLELRYDPRDPDLVGNVQITKSSLNVFSILENTGSIDAEYAYRDFKELVVELNYFDKEDLSTKIQGVFTWLLPESDVFGWPVRPWDKQDVDYGTLIQSKATYEALGLVATEEESTSDEEPDEEDTDDEDGTDDEGDTDEVDNVATIQFEGYEEGKPVVSPVTGKILEIGTHERLNVYSGEMEEVEFITIQVLDSINYFQGERLGTMSSYEEEEYGYRSSTQYTLAQALDLFYREYSDVCMDEDYKGYTITIDGFDVDLLYTGEDENASGSLGSDIQETLNNGVYKQNEVHALYNSEEMAKLEEIEQAKEDAPFFINCRETNPYPVDGYVGDPNSIVGYYIKEGKYLGKTIEPNAKKAIIEGLPEFPEGIIPPEGIVPGVSLPAIPQVQLPQTSTSTEGIDDKLTYTYDDFKNVPGDYIRIIIKDSDYAIVDDVERFFKIP